MECFVLYYFSCENGLPIFGSIYKEYGQLKNIYVFFLTQGKTNACKKIKINKMYTNHPQNITLQFCSCRILYSYDKIVFIDMLNHTNNDPRIFDKLRDKL